MVQYGTEYHNALRIGRLSSGSSRSVQAREEEEAELSGPILPSLLGAQSLDAVCGEEWIVMEGNWPLFLALNSSPMKPPAERADRAISGPACNCPVATHKAVIEDNFPLRNVAVGGSLSPGPVVNYAIGASDQHHNRGTWVGRVDMEDDVLHCGVHRHLSKARQPGVTLSEAIDRCIVSIFLPAYHIDHHHPVLQHGMFGWIPVNAKRGHLHHSIWIHHSDASKSTLRHRKCHGNAMLTALAGVVRSQLAPCDGAFESGQVILSPTCNTIRIRVRTGPHRETTSMDATSTTLNGRCMLGGRLEAPP